MSRRVDRFGPKTVVIRIDPNAKDKINRHLKDGETISDLIRRMAKALEGRA